jgi:MerR HTH family regulatory protein
MSVSAAAKRAGVSPRTIRLWCENDGIGRKILGSSWRVSRVALQMKLETLKRRCRYIVKATGDIQA